MYSEATYEEAGNILHIWYPRPVYLDDEAVIVDFFRETLEERIRPCPLPPYLLVNYANVSLRPDQAEAYARNIALFQGLVRGTFRYGVAPGAQGRFTAVAVHLGNMKLAARSNIFATEEDARAAIRAAQLSTPAASWPAAR